MPVSSAVGWAEGCGVDVRKIINEADTKMYENKTRGKECRNRMANWVSAGCGVIANELAQAMEKEDRNCMVS